MKGNILIIILGILLMTGFASATSISIDSVTSKDRNGNNISSATNTGDQLIAEITVTNPNVFQDVNYTYITWTQSNNPNASLSCNSRWDLPITQTDWHWECNLTVTPQMNISTNVYVNVNTHSGNNAQISLGIFNFKGNPLTVYKFVQFNGVWNDGSTLYSNWMNITSMQGKDVYPTSPTCMERVVCAQENYTWNKTCVLYKFGAWCIKYKLVSVDNGCKRYTTHKICSYSSPLCFNADGSKTNKLDLSNLYYTEDGINWTNVPYSKFNLNSQVQFKIVIPAFCVPVYDINKSVQVSC